MSANIDFDRHAAGWLADGPTELADRVLDAALREVHLTKQRRALRVPWRFPLMPALTRATIVASVALVAAVGVGGVIYVSSTDPGGTRTSPPATQAPTAAPSVAPTAVLPPGITGWTTYTSGVYGLEIGYPSDWSLNAAATRTWQAGDALTTDSWPFADTFVSPGEGDASVGLFVWEMPRGADGDWLTVDDLKAWAEAFCIEVGASACDTFTENAVPMCVALVIDPDQVECDNALLVPTAEAQFAFFGDRGSLLLTDVPDRVTVVVIAREDGFGPAARYGGSLALLKAVLTTMDVWTEGHVPLPYPD